MPHGFSRGDLEVRGKGVGSQLPERLFGCFAQLTPDPFARPQEAVEDLMLGCKQDTWWHRLWLVGHVASLSMAFYLYVLLRIRPELLYQQRSQVFVFDSYLAAEFFRWPGGPVQYVSAFLSPLLACNWLGALIITLLALLICLATRHFLTALTGMGGKILFLVPGVLLVLLLGQYLHPLEPCIGLFVVLVCANAYARIAASCVTARFAAFVLAGVLVYYVAAGLYVVFALLCAIIEWRVKRQWLLGTLEALSTAVVPSLMGIGWFALTIAQAYEGLTPPNAMYWLEVPASARAAGIAWGSLLFLAPCRRYSARGPPLVAENAESGFPACSPLRTRRKKPTSRSAGLACVLRLATPSLALLAMGCLADLLAFDAPRRCTIQIARSVEQRRWPEVLTLASQIPPRRLHVAVMVHVNRALYHTGGLLEGMFRPRPGHAATDAGSDSPRHQRDGCHHAHGVQRYPLRARRRQRIGAFVLRGNRGLWRSAAYNQAVGLCPRAQGPAGGGAKISVATEAKLSAPPNGHAVIASSSTKTRCLATWLRLPNVGSS